MMLPPIVRYRAHVIGALRAGNRPMLPGDFDERLHEPPDRRAAYAAYWDARKEQRETEEPRDLGPLPEHWRGVTDLLGLPPMPHWKAETKPDPAPVQQPENKASGEEQGELL